MMSQGVLEFQYQPDTTKTGLTAYGGLPPYLDLAFQAGVVESIRRHVWVWRGGQGWTDERVVLALMLLNLAGGESVPIWRCSMRTRASLGCYGGSSSTVLVGGSVGRGSDAGARSEGAVCPRRWRHFGIWRRSRLPGTQRRWGRR